MALATGAEGGVADGVGLLSVEGLGACSTVRGGSVCDGGEHFGVCDAASALTAGEELVAGSVELVHAARPDLGPGEQDNEIVEFALFVGGEAVVDLEKLID